jgi:hypothetical protein
MEYFSPEHESPMYYNPVTGETRETCSGPVSTNPGPADAVKFSLGEGLSPGFGRAREVGTQQTGRY